MLEQLFGSKTRVMLLRLFLNNPEKFYYVRELTRSLDAHLNSIRRELNNLQKIGLINFYTKTDLAKEVEKEIKDNKKYYQLNNDFVFAAELKSLINKAQLVLEQSLVRKVEDLGNVRLFLLSGVFVGREDAPVDLLVVGAINKNKLNGLVRGFEKDLGKPINFTSMTATDFKYRYEITDRFLYDLLGGKSLVVMDSIWGKLQQTP